MKRVESALTVNMRPVRVYMSLCDIYAQRPELDPYMEQMRYLSTKKALPSLEYLDAYYP